MDSRDGTRTDTGSGNGVLVSFPAVADPEQKAKLGKSYGAQAVDMEAAAVAKGAEARGLRFAAVKAISDEVELRLKREGVYPHNIEGFKQAEWVLIDYVDFVVHIFSQTARHYYDLERLWRTAKKLQLSELTSKSRRRAAVPRPVRKRA